MIALALVDPLPVCSRMSPTEVMRERFTNVVEEAPGRRVIGFMSGNQRDPDMICEVFVLARNSVLD
jgi:hypothetical protein